MSFLKSFNYRKEACGYAKGIHEKRKKRRRENIDKNGQVSEILKTMGTQMPAQKRR